MTTAELQAALLERLGHLQPGLQRRVLDFADALVRSEPRDVRGESLFRFAGTFDSDSLREMEEAIEEGCEQVDASSPVKGQAVGSW